MPTIYKLAEFMDALRESGIGQGDLVHVHSALFALGIPEGVAVRDIPAAIYDAVRNVIGPNGTLTVAAAFENYARFSQPYDCALSPVDNSQGIFNGYVAAREDAVRSYCPMCGVAGIGPLAQAICHSRTASGMGTDSAWDHLYRRDAKLCWIGVPPHQAFTYAQFIQFRWGVPYLYNKIYTVPIYEQGERVDLPVTCCVRYRNTTYRISEDCTRFEAHLRGAGLIREARVGDGQIYTMPSAQRVFNEGTDQLRSDIYYFCKVPPEFVPGEIPMDGATGAFISDDLRYKKLDKS